MTDIQFPVLVGEQIIYPQEALCPWCKQNKVLEPHSMAILSGGALAPDGENFKIFDKAATFFSLIWHGAHSDMNGLGQYPDRYAEVNIVDTISIGQFDFYFCSTNCLRGFLNYCVDELEQRIEQSRQNRQSSETSY